MFGVFFHLFGLHYRTGVFQGLFFSYTPHRLSSVEEIAKGRTKRYFPLPTACIILFLTHTPFFLRVVIIYLCTAVV